MPSAQFLNLPAESQDRIFQAALEEFAERGYDLASTNRIVEAAGISKGVLFKYFRDKEALFLYVADRVLRAYLDSLPGEESGDIFDWLKAATAYKLRFLHEKPVIYSLTVRLMKEPAHPVYQKALAGLGTAQGNTVPILRALVPTDRLRPGVTPDDVVQLLMWVAFGLGERFAPAAPDRLDEGFDTAYKRLVDEFDHYIAILKGGLFREEVRE